MATQFDSTQKEDIRSRINIADVVGRYVTLKGAGQSLKGLCPFHKEKTPSFTVNPGRNVYHCFGCGKGGDVFSFIMEIEGVGFPEALKMLADEAGVTLTAPSTYSPPPPGPTEDGAVQTTSNINKTELIRIHQLAVQFYYDQMKQSSRAIEYFKQRGLSGETVREFGLGYAPGGWSNLITYCKQQKIAPEALIACGLAISKNEGNEPYDRFRDRIMFPLFDSTGRAIGFAGRTLDANATPKYLNSPETALYQKNRFLYGLHKARGPIKEKSSVILVEGYMDFLALYQAGIRNVLATSGTALTAEHGQMVRRFSNRVYLLFDGDAAGVNAAKRAIFVLAPHSLDIRVLLLPPEEDPDTFVQKFGADKLYQMLDQAIPGMQFIIEKLIAEKGSNSPYSATAVLSELMPLIGVIPDTIIKSDFIKKLSERLDIKEHLIYDKLKKGYTTSDASISTVLTINPERYVATIEGNFMRLCITSPDLIPLALPVITPETFSDRFSSNVYSTIIKAFECNRFLDTILDLTDDTQIKGVLSFILARPSELSNTQEELVYTMKRLQKKHMQKEIHSLRRMLENGNSDTQALLKRHNELTIQLKEFDGIL